MISRLPIIAPAATGGDIVSALLAGGPRQNPFARQLISSIGMAHVYLTGSGSAAFYCCLSMLAKTSFRKEMVLPAYTAGSLVTVARQAGLTPVLCDISPEDFNLDIAKLPGSLSARTLAVVPVHMFGIGVKDIGTLKEATRGIYLVEDCCQAMGSIAGARPVGKTGDISLFSFNRGKNFPLSGGGCCGTNNELLAKELGKETVRLSRRGGKDSLAAAARALAFYIGTRQLLYGLANGLAARFRETTPPKSIPLEAMTDFDAGLGSRLLQSAEALFSLRYSNGMFLLNGLKGIPGIRLPRFDAKDRPVFNRFPVVFEDLGRLSRVEKELWKQGIESSRMYAKPLHHMFDLGYKPEEFPEACFFAQHLLTLPVHPQCSQKQLERMMEVIKRWA